MKILVESAKRSSKQKNIFIPLFQGAPVNKERIFSFLPAHIQEAAAALSKEEFRGEEGETKSVWFPNSEIKRVRLFGLGERAKWNERKAPMIARRMVQCAKAEKIEGFAIPLSSLPKTGQKDAAKIFAANALLADYEYAKYKTPPPGGVPEVAAIIVLADEEEFAETEKGIREGMIIGEEANHCRDLANMPGSDMTPAVLAAEAKNIAKKNPSVKVKILDEPEIKKLGMGGVLGVSRGSAEKPKFIIIEYRGAEKNKKPLALVGKGVTFDTGGINLKPGQYMYEMHMDMSGGAAVIHGIAAAARLRIPVNLVGLVPAVENMPSGSSYRPGDLLKSMSGKVIEVLDTDAEGRVILSDALSYALRYKPGLIVDFATLTGAAHVALGHYMSALFTNREELAEKLARVGNASGDYVWPMPLWDEYLADIKGTFGDLANVGKTDRYGGAIHGAKFLEQFVDNVPWAHIDIAPRMTSVEQDALAKGASGVGVRYIVELAKNYEKIIASRD